MALAAAKGTKAKVIRVTPARIANVAKALPPVVARCNVIVPKITDGTAKGRTRTGRISAPRFIDCTSDAPKTPKAASPSVPVAKVGTSQPPGG